MAKRLSTWPPLWQPCKAHLTQPANSPRLPIVGIFTARFGARKLSEEEGRVLKLLSGLMMLLLGIVLIVAPTLLNDITTALGLLLVTLLMTGLLVWVDRRWLHPSPTHLRKT